MSNKPVYYKQPAFTAVPDGVVIAAYLCTAAMLPVSGLTKENNAKQLGHMDPTALYHPT